MLARSLAACARQASATAQLALVHSASQSLNELRKPCGTASIPRRSDSSETIHLTALPVSYYWGIAALRRRSVPVLPPELQQPGRTEVHGALAAPSFELPVPSMSALPGQPRSSQLRPLRRPSPLSESGTRTPTVWQGGRCCCGSMQPQLAPGQTAGQDDAPSAAAVG